MSVQRLLASREASRASLLKRYKRIVREFAQDKEASDADDVLADLSVSLEDFAEDIAKAKRRLHLVEQIKAGETAYQKARDIEAQAEEERQQFHTVEVAFKASRSKLFQQREIYDSQVDLARRARVELAATADAELINTVKATQQSLDAVRQQRADTETRLRRAKSIPPRGEILMGGETSPGPDTSLIARLQGELTALTATERELTEALKSARAELLLP
jgi:hypothetical protein